MPRPSTYGRRPSCLLSTGGWPDCSTTTASTRPAKALATASQAASNNDGQARQLELRRRLKECEAKLAKYRAALEHNPNITTVADWIAEVEQQRRAIEHELGRTPTTRRLTKNEVRALVGRLGEITAVLADADPEDKRAVYAELGVNLTYQPDGTVLAKAGAPQVDACTNECVGGATSTPSTRDPWEAWLELAAA